MLSVVSINYCPENYIISMNNRTVLGGIMDSLIKAEKTNDLRDNEYIGMAKEYLTESIKYA